MADDGKPFRAHELGIETNFRINHKDCLSKDVCHKHIAKHAEQERPSVDKEICCGLSVGSGEERKHINVKAPSTGL